MTSSPVGPRLASGSACEDFDVIIVGAGPAGLIAARQIKEIRPALSVAIVDKGPDIDARKCPAKEGFRCVDCSPCRIICGPGGAGSFSDGKMFFEEAGGYLEEEGDRFTNAALIRWVQSYFLDLFPKGLPGKRLAPSEGPQVESLKEKIRSAGLGCRTNAPHHLGTENCHEFVTRIVSDLKTRAVKFYLNSNAANIAVDNEGRKIVSARAAGENLVFRSPYLILAVGKGGSEWLAEQMKRIGIEPVENPTPYIGVRIEASQEILKPLTALGGDPKIWYERAGTTDRTKTHCFADGGYAVQINYDNGITLVDGYSYVAPERRSPSSSVNILVRTAEKISSDAWLHLLKHFNFIGEKGFPKLQRLEDFHNQLSSSKEKISSNKIKPTLQSYSLEDINLALSRRVAGNIIEFIHRLDKVIPGIDDNDTLLYAPAAEWYIPRWVPKPAIKYRMQPPGAEGIFIIGDGAGLSQGIIMAGTTGVVAGWTIATEMTK